MKPILPDKILVRFMNIVLIFLSGTFLLKAASSLRWRMEHDFPLSHYVVFMMDKYGAIPYRDIFETVMPGTYAFQYIIVKLFGYSDFAFRCVDLSLLAILLLATYIFMSRFGKTAAIWASVIFGLIYLSKGQAMSLQRDYFGIIPIAIALTLIPAKSETIIGLFRFAAVGYLFGLSVLIKPQLGIALPIILGTLLTMRWTNAERSTRDFIKCVSILGLAFAIPVLSAVTWLAANSALIPFANIFFKYLPLYSALTGDHESISSIDHVYYLIHWTLELGGYGSLFIYSLFFYYRTMTDESLSKPLITSLTCMFLCTLAFAIYPTLSGKFWDYHYMPFAYFCSISSGLCFVNWPSFRNTKLKWRFWEFSAVLIFLVVITVQLNPYQFFPYLYQDVRGLKSHAPVGGRVDEIAKWLKKRLRPGDTVQPLDWTGGSIQAMLLAEAKLSTNFMFDAQFYHHVSSPYTQELRKEFISQLVANPPRFIIEIQTYKYWVSGIDTTREFPELEEFLNDYYTVVKGGDGYLIHERIILQP